MLVARRLEVLYPSGGFLKGRTWFKAVRGVDLELEAGASLGLVGESGSGKSSLARGLMGLTPEVRGEVLFKGQNLVAMPSAERNRLRAKIQMVFQDPHSSLNPRFTVFRTLAEGPRLHLDLRGAELEEWVAKLMERVGLTAEMKDRYPHEFSGGQRQRIGIARALSTRPEVLVADEPVSALDVSIQAQVINLLHQLRQELGLALLFISHDLAVVRQLCRDVAVMYQGRIVERGSAEAICDRPLHPYTRELVAAAPSLSRPRERTEQIERDPSPSGCSFSSRCPLARTECQSTLPKLEGEAHRVACPVVLEERNPEA